MVIDQCNVLGKYIFHSKQKVNRMTHSHLDARAQSFLKGFHFL